MFKKIRECSIGSMTEINEMFCEITSDISSDKLTNMYLFTKRQLIIASNGDIALSIRRLSHVIGVSSLLKQLYIDDDRLHDIMICGIVHDAYKFSPSKYGTGKSGDLHGELASNFLKMMKLIEDDELLYAVALHSNKSNILSDFHNMLVCCDIVIKPYPDNINCDLNKQLINNEWVLKQDLPKEILALANENITYINTLISKEKT